MLPARWGLHLEKATEEMIDSSLLRYTTLHPNDWVEEC